MATELITSRLESPNSSLRADADLRSDVDAGLIDYEASLERVRQYAELASLPFMLVDVSTGVVLGGSSGELLPVLPAEVQKRLKRVTDVSLLELASGLVFYIVPLPETDGGRTAGVGYVLANAGIRPNDIVLAAVEQNWSQQRLDQWYEELPICSPSLLHSLLRSVANQVRGAAREAAMQAEIDDLSSQIDQTFEEISLLHNVTTNLQISKSPAELAELCLERMEELVRAEGKAIWLEEGRGGTTFLIDGELPFDEIGLARLISRFEAHEWSRPLVKNHIEGSLLGADFHGLRNFVITSISEGTHRSGWIICCNQSAGEEFGTVEASLLNSVATILGTHLRNIDLYSQHDELLLSFVRSLVSTLDAKDPYTRGHSERVALIARRIGQELDLPEEDLKDIYLSGLLHDIGKIGVNDQILQKPGQLTDEEFKQIQKHPMMGYNILSELKNLHHILPGVRHHHENYNGKGYPDSLKGEEIPLMARIMAVADSYDAMGSDRPYRKGMPQESIENIFRRGSGDQWDAAIIDAYFAARDDILRICEEYSPANGNLL
jgi:HD-GYP domain-containing protein (c-di-GMP phosphodiesterase class II)